ncbi:MAG: class F sortase [Lapillicoccus sp.]
MTDALAGAGGHEPARPGTGTGRGDSTDQLASDSAHSRDALTTLSAAVRRRVRTPVPTTGVVVVAALALVGSGMMLEHHLDTGRAAAISSAAGPAAAFLESDAAGAPAAALPGSDQVVAGTSFEGPPLAATDEAAAPATVVHIPKLGLNQPLVGLHVQADQSLSVPTQFTDVGWWESGPHPGAPGAMVVAAHVTSRAGPAVFARLKELAPGDQVMVDRADRTTALFQVVQKISYPRSGFPDDIVYRTSGKSSLHLVTCDGVFNAAVGQYPENLVVFADLVSTGPTP